MVSIVDCRGNDHEVQDCPGCHQGDELDMCDHHDEEHGAAFCVICMRCMLQTRPCSNPAFAAEVWNNVGK